MELKKQLEVFSHIINNYELDQFIRDNDYFENKNLNKIFKGILKGYEHTNKIIKDVNRLYELCNEDVEKKYIVKAINLKPKTDREILKYEAYDYFKEKEKEIDEKKYNEIIKSDILFNTPFLTNSYDNLPKNLKDILDLYHDARKKDVMFLSLISFLSVLVDNFYFFNTDYITHPNLYTFIGAQAGSGKGSVADAKNILYEYIKKEIDDNDMLEAKSISDAEYTDKDGTIKYKKIIQPKFKKTILAANSSTAKLYENLNNNRNNTGILFTTEVSELSGNNKNEWGGYDVILRQSFHNETISTERVSGVNVNIDEPHLSVLATGTMDQYVDMFASKTTNGLFSRCMFYLYKTDLSFFDKDKKRYNRTSNSLSQIQFIKLKSKNFYDMFKYFSLFKQIEVDMEEEDYDFFIDYFEKLNIKNLENYDDEISATNRRFASIAKRLAMIITGIRYYEDNIDEINEVLSNNFNSMFDDYDYKKIIVSRTDIEFIIEIMDNLIKHTLLLYSTLEYNIEKKEVIIKSNNNELVLDAMEDEFSIKFMKEYADKKYNISNKTIECFVNRCVKSKKLKSTSRGMYKKIK